MFDRFKLEGIIDKLLLKGNMIRDKLVLEEI